MVVTLVVDLHVKTANYSEIENPPYFTSLNFSFVTPHSQIKWLAILAGHVNRKNQTSQSPDSPPSTTKRFPAFQFQSASTGMAPHVVPVTN